MRCSNCAVFFRSVDVDLIARFQHSGSPVSPVGFRLHRCSAIIERRPVHFTADEARLRQLAFPWLQAFLANRTDVAPAQAP